MDHFHPILLSHLSNVLHRLRINGISPFSISFRSVYGRVGGAIDQILDMVIRYKSINLTDVGNIQTINIGKKNLNGRFILSVSALISLPNCPSDPVTSTFFCTSP